MPQQPISSAASLPYPTVDLFFWQPSDGRVNFGDFLNHAIGAVLMGIGGVLSMGCTIGQGISGFSTLALGSILTFPLAVGLGFDYKEAAAIAIVGGADGPMVLFTSLELAKKLFVPISVVAYVYLSITYALYPYMNVFENIKLGLTDESQNRDEEFSKARVQECLRLVNLAPETQEKFPAQLSGGMRKRVGIARAIAGKPKYLLYDEPTSGRDPVNSDIIDELVKRLASELGVTSVMVTHDVRGAFRVADRLALLTGGKIVQHGTPQEFLASTEPKVKEFLERDFENATFAA